MGIRDYGMARPGRRGKGCRVSISDIIATGRRLIGSLVHSSVPAGSHLFDRHRTFISSHLIGGLLAIALLPFLLLGADRLDGFILVTLTWLAVPIAVAIFLSRTGRLAPAHLLSSLSLAGLAAYVAFHTGGVQSFALVWLAVVPVEASLSGSRRVIGAAFAAGFAAIIALFIAGGAGLLPPTRVDPVQAMALLAAGSLTAAAYAGSIAINVHKFNLSSAKSLRRSETHYRLLAENASDLITRHTSDGDVTFASGAAQSLLGCNVAALEGAGLYHCVHPDDRSEYLNALAVLLETGSASSAEFRMRVELGDDEDRTDGASALPSHFVWVEMRCRRIPDDDSAGGQIVAITRDISERIAQQAELRRARDEAEAANRAKTFFLANMSHELRTPLNAIIGFSEILSDARHVDTQDPKTSEYAGLIHQSGAHLLQVVNDLLDMSKIEAGKMELDPDEIDLRSPVNDCVRVMTGTAEEKGVVLVAELPDEALELTADMRACKQILLNLISNAIKFSSSGGNVSVRAERNGDGMLLTVRDQGVGIAPDVLPKLGAPFVQGDLAYSRSHVGTGLGLSVTKGLVQLHGGRIEISSVLGAGTTVSVWLPVAVPGEKGAGLRTGRPSPAVEVAETTLRRRAARG